MPNITKEYYHNIDLLANQLINGRLHNLTTTERINLGSTLTSADIGYVVYDTTLLVTFFWDGTQWTNPSGGTGRGTPWGTIIGNITDQTDLISYLSSYLTSATAASTYVPLTRELTINGVTHNLSSNASWSIAAGVSNVTASVPLSSSGGATPNITIQQASGSQGGYLSSTDWTTFNTKEPAISAGTTSQYWRGDKTWQNFPTIPTVTPSALTKVDDTNVTLTLGGSPSTALLAATSLTLGWTGTLADSRIASASTWNAKQNALSGTGIVKSTAGTISYLTDNTANWDVAYSNRITSLTTTGTGAATLVSNVLNIPTPPTATFTSLTTTGSSGSSTLSSGVLNVPTYTLAGLGGIGLTALSSTATGLTYTNTTGVFSLTSGYVIPTTTEESNWNTAYTNRITSLTTTGSSGSATLSSNTLNIPTYTLSGLGGVPTSRNLTINGTTYDLSADRTWTISAGVSSVGATSPITSTGGSTPVISTSMSTGKLIGRYSSGTGVMEEVTVGSGLTLTGVGVLNNTATPTPLGYYGAWQDNATQSAAASNVGYAMIFGTVDLENQVRVVTNGTNLTRITFDNTGIYNLQFSAQFQNSGNSDEDVTIWLRKGGTDVIGSAGFVSVPKRRAAGAGNEGHCLPSWNYLLSIVAGEYYEIVWSTTNHSTVTLQYYAAGNPPPSTASVIATVTQQSGIMAGTGMTALNGLSGAVQTFTNDTNVTIVSSGTAHAITWSGTLADSRIASSSSWNTAYTDRLKWDGGSTGLTASTGRTSLGATTVGSNLFTLTNPSAITFPRINADNTISTLDAATFRTAIGAGTSSTTGTVTSVAALTLGTTGTDLSSSVATGTTTPVITLNVPDASATARGVINTNSQTIAGAKTFSTAPILSSLTASQILALDASGNIQSLAVATYPSLTELSYVKGVTSAIQTQINGKQATLTNPVTGTGTNNEIAYFNTTGSTVGSLSTATYPSLTELSYVKGVTSAVQTQLAAKQDLSLSAYTFRANNTNATANATNNTFVDTSGTYTPGTTGTVTWSGTAPTSLSNGTYKYTQVGKMCTISITLLYGTGGTNSSVDIVLPSICATPDQPGFTSTNDFLYAGSGMMSVSTAGKTMTSTNPNANRACYIKKNASGQPSMVITAATSGTVTFASGTITYYTI